MRFKLRKVGPKYRIVFSDNNQLVKDGNGVAVDDGGYSQLDIAQQKLISLLARLQNAN